MEFGAGPSLRLDVCRLDDWRPEGNLALHERGERLLSALGLVRNVAAEVEQAFAHVRIVERLVERVGKFVEDGLWSSLGREQGVPGRSLVLRQSGLLRSWNIGQVWIAVSSTD